MVFAAYADGIEHDGADLIGGEMQCGDAVAPTRGLSGVGVDSSLGEKLLSEMVFAAYADGVEHDGADLIGGEMQCGDAVAPTRILSGVGVDSSLERSCCPKWYLLPTQMVSNTTALT